MSYALRIYRKKGELIAIFTDVYDFRPHDMKVVEYDGKDVGKFKWGEEQKAALSGQQLGPAVLGTTVLYNPSQRAGTSP